MQAQSIVGQVLTAVKAEASRFEVDFVVAVASKQARAAVPLERI
jgi:hypothetical protein